MDPNRNKLETILKLPTKRLLNVYRKERLFRPMPEHWVASVWDCGCPSCTRARNTQDERLKIIKEELDKREHLSK
jgi:hypothetical protein